MSKQEHPPVHFPPYRLKCSMKQLLHVPDTVLSQFPGLDVYPNNLSGEIRSVSMDTTFGLTTDPPLQQGARGAARPALLAEIYIKYSLNKLLLISDTAALQQ